MVVNLTEMTKFIRAAPKICSGKNFCAPGMWCITNFMLYWAIDLAPPKVNSDKAIEVASSHCNTNCVCIYIFDLLISNICCGKAK